MGVNGYKNEENKYSEIIKDLGELPKIQTLDNFEFNLITRIQNGNLENLEDLRESHKQFNVIKFLAPSAAVVTLLILFFLFLPNSEQQIEDPLMSDPPAINYNTDKEPVPSSISEPGSSDSRLRQNENNTMNREGQTFLNQDYKVVVRPNDVVVKEKANYPIFKNRSVKLDDYISGNNQRNNNLMQGNVVRSGEDEFDFEGFLLRQQPDQRTIQKYRDMIDSVKRAQAKADSIKKASK